MSDNTQQISPENNPTEKPFSAEQISRIERSTNNVQHIDVTERFTTAKMGFGADVLTIEAARKAIESLGDEHKDVMDKLRSQYEHADIRNVNYGLNTRYSGITEQQAVSVDVKEYSLAASLMGRFNQELYGSADTKDGPFATIDANGNKLEGQAFTDLVRDFQKTVLRNSEDELAHLAVRSEAQVTVGGVENDARYQILKQQFNNPELLRDLSPESYQILMDIKNDTTLNADEQLERYFNICDTNAVEQGVLTAEQAKFYHQDFLKPQESLLTQPQIRMTEHGLDVPPEALNSLLKSFLRGENILAPHLEQQHQEQFNVVKEVSQVALQGNLPPLPPERQQELNTALDYQNKATEEMEQAANNFTHDNANKPEMALENNFGLHNRNHSQATPKPKR